MDYFELQEFMQAANPGKKIFYEFDENCHRIIEIVLTEGKPNLAHHVESRRVKVTVAGSDPVYVPITPHREIYSWVDIKKMIIAKNDVHVNQSEIDQVKQLPPEERERVIKNLSDISGLSFNQMRAKVQ